MSQRQRAAQSEPAVSTIGNPSGVSVVVAPRSRVIRSCKVWNATGVLRVEDAPKAVKVVHVTQFVPPSMLYSSFTVLLAEISRLKQWAVSRALFAGRSP